MNYIVSLLNLVLESSAAPSAWGFYKPEPIKQESK